ncbi:MAG: TetR family transcriptional regulator [Dehalococcoidia bacterium]
MALARGSTETRLAILQAADRLVRAEGVAHLTLEAVARAAGVSKGGLLYHFPSKDALIAGMLGRLLDVFEADIERQRVADTGPVTGRWLRAYVRASFALPDEEIAVGSALLAAVATDPELMLPARRRFEAWQDRAAADGVDPAIATVIRLAADGQWFADLFGLAPPGGQRRRDVLERLLQLTEGGVL